MKSHFLIFAMLALGTWSNEAFEFVTTIVDPSDPSTNKVRIRKLYSILCDSVDHGPVYGKLNNDGEAYYSFDEKLYACDKYTLVEGEPIENTGSIPEECEEHRRTQKTGIDFYPVIVKSRYGLIPGKADTPEVGYFAWKDQQLGRKTFKWFC